MKTLALLLMLFTIPTFAHMNGEMLNGNPNQTIKHVSHPCHHIHIFEGQSTDESNWQYWTVDADESTYDDTNADRCGNDGGNTTPQSPVQQTIGGEGGDGTSNESVPKDDDGNTAPPILEAPQPPRNTPPVQRLAKLLVTEYMVRDWSHHNSHLPQVIEIYNPNQTSVNLNGYTLDVWEWQKGEYQKRTLEIGEIPIPPKAVVLLVTHLVSPNRSTADPSRVFNLAIGNILKKGFALKDPTGTVIVDIPNPQKPRHQGKSRVSHHRYKNTVTEYDDPHYYGYPLDICTLGVHEFVRPAPSHPPRRKMTGMWATLKQR